MATIMNSSKSMSWLRQPLLSDKTGYYTNQPQKNSTQNIHSMLKADDSHQPQDRNGSASAQRNRCCRDGQILKSSEDTGNCSNCGQFFIYLRHGGVVRALREKGKEFTLDFPISQILHNMRTKSQETISLLNPHETYLKKRKQLVDWISGVGESLQITSATIHHCVLLMDLYTSIQPNILSTDLQLISISCLMISTKFHEMKYPSAMSLNSATKNMYTYESIISKEGEILDVLNWDLLRYTVLDYVNVFINQGCLFETDSIATQNAQQSSKSPNTSVMTKSNITPQSSEYLRRYAEFFTDFCIQEESFLYVNQLFLACAILAFSRRYSKVSVIYPDELEKMTGVPLVLVKSLYHQLENRYFECFPDQRQQSTQLFQHQIHSQQTSEQSVGDRKQSKGSLQLFGSGSSNKKTQPTSNDKSSINNSGRPRLLIDVETPNKSTFEFGTIMVKSNDKLSSQKTTANTHSNPKQRNPSQVAQLRLTTNPPDSVKKFAIKKSIIGALESAAHTSNLSMLQAAQEQSEMHNPQPVSTSSRNKSAIGFGLHRVTAALKQQSINGPSQTSISREKHSSMEKRQSQQTSFINDSSINEGGPSTKKLQNSKSQVSFANVFTQKQGGDHGQSKTSKNASTVRPATANHSAVAVKSMTGQMIQPSTKVNNYLTIDVSGQNPNALGSQQQAPATIQNGGAQTNREAQMASRIPRQKVLNIKLKENQFVPMTVTNKDRDSFKFSTTHLMQKMLNGGGNSSNQPSSIHNTSSGSISTRNLSLAHLHQSKEAAIAGQNQLILQRYHLRANGAYASNHEQQMHQQQQQQQQNYNSVTSNQRPSSSGYPLSQHQQRMNSSLNKAEIVKQLNVSRERLNSLLQNAPPSGVQLRGMVKRQ